MGAHRKPNPLARLSAAAGLAGVAAAVLPGTAQAATPQINWGPIIACESGGNPTAQNPASTASGLFQFLDTSWAAYGGTRFSSRALGATPAEQYQVANTAYAQSGLSPWEASRGCWGGQLGAILAGGVPAPAAVQPAPAPAPVVAQPRHAAPAHQPPAASSGHAPRHAVPEPVHPAAQAAIGHGGYVVKAGDTLWGIAVRHDWPALYAANRAAVGDNPDLIHPGLHLQV